MAIRNNDFSMFDNVEDSGGDMVSQYDELTRFLNSGSNKKTEVDPARDAVITALAKQILAQGRSGQWKGEGLGSAEANARQMAEIMADTGITDIKQFGQFTKEIPTYTTDDSGNSIQDGTQTITTYGNKETGKEVANTYGERQTGNSFGGTFSGEGNTGYRVNFDAQGNPIFYTTPASSNDLAALMQDAGPVFQIGLALATGGLSIPQQIAARLAVNVLSGQDVGDAIKGAAISMAVVNIPGMDFMKEGGTFIKGLNLGEAVTNTLTNSFQNAVTSGATAALTGKSVGDAMVTGAISGGVNGAVGALLNSADMKELTKDLSATEKRLVSNAVSGVISGKPLDQILINSAIAAANAEINNVKNPPSTAGVDKATIGDFDDTEVTRLSKLGYTKDQIKEYFGRLENLTGAFDDPQEPIPVKNTSDDVVEKLKSAGLTQSSNAEQLASITGSVDKDTITGGPTGLQLAAADTGVTSDAGGGVFRTDIGGSPIYAESSGADRVKPPFGYQLTSANEADAKPAGSYYDPTTNAWFSPEKSVTNLTSSEGIAADADLFNKTINQLVSETPAVTGNKEAEDNEVLINAQLKAREDAEAAARAEQERLARETQQAAIVAQEKANKLASEIKNIKDLETARKAQEDADRLAKEAKDKADNEVLINAKAQADAEAARVAAEEKAARIAKEEHLARETQQAAENARITKEAKDADDARIAKEAYDARIAKEAYDARIAKEAKDKADNEVLITAKAKADAEAARVAAEAKRAEEERLAREAQQTAITPKKLEEVLVEDKKLTPEQPIPSPIDDYFKTIPKDIDILKIIGDRPVNYLPTDDDFPATPITDKGILEVIGDRPVNYLPTDDDFPATPIPTTPGVIPTPKIPTPTVAKPAIPSVKPATPAASPSMDLNGVLALLSGQRQPAQQAPMQDPYAHIKLMEELFGPTINLTPAGENTTQRK